VLHEDSNERRLTYTLMCLLIFFFHFFCVFVLYNDAANDVDCFPSTIGIKFCFQFNREGTHKTLDKELVIMLLQLLLNDSPRVSSERLQSFCQFLEQNAAYTRITLDQWTSFWDFTQECEDIHGYDESTSAWPVLIDDYVEYLEQTNKHTN
jgi:Cullin binding